MKTVEIKFCYDLEKIKNKAIEQNKTDEQVIADMISDEIHSIICEYKQVLICVKDGRDKMNIFRFN